MCPTYVYICPSCKETTDGFFTLKEIRPDTIPCKSCGQTAQYELSAPTVLKASYLDGQRSKQWKDLKEASKLNRLAASTDKQEDKQALKKEAAKIGYKFSNDPD